MTRVCLVLRAHRPWRLRAYNYFDVGRSHDYFGAEETARRFARADALWIRPAVEAVGGLLARRPRFAFALAASGPFLAQLWSLCPERLAALRELVASGRVEPLGATSHQSLRRAVSPAETARQVRLHRALALETLGREPRVFGGEEPPDPEALAAILEAEGFRGMVLEGATEPPPGRARRRPYRAGDALAALVADTLPGGSRGRRGADSRRAPRWLAPGRLDDWISSAPGDILAASMDLAAFGSPGAPEGAVAALLEDAVARVEKAGGAFATPSEAIDALSAEDPLPARPGAAVGSNELQRDALARLAALEPAAAGAAPDAAEDFRRLTGADHFAAMSLRPPGSRKTDDDAEPPYETYMAFRHALTDLARRLEAPPSRRGASAAASPA